MEPISFSIDKKLSGKGGRAGTLSTRHGAVQTPAFVTVGTKGTVKALTTEQIKEAGAQIVLANTYHLYLQPGEEIIKEHGGLNKFMNWSGPTMTDSGGFQVFSLGEAFGSHVSKLAGSEDGEKQEAPAIYDKKIAEQHGRLAVVDEEGVSFTSHLDGTLHRFTPERSIEIQHSIGADIIFAFDECTSPNAKYNYQEDALERTHRWAERSLKAHRQNTDAQRTQGLFGIVQGGRHEDLRRKSARVIRDLDFSGYGIGGSYVKEDLDTAVGWVCDELSDGKPRHLLGIGEPEDLVRGVEKGVDLFDCVLPTRLGRNGTLYTRSGKINILNSKYIRDYSEIDSECLCTICRSYTRAYIAHLFRSKEMLGATLASIHNIHFLITLVSNLRSAIIDNVFDTFVTDFLSQYKK